MSSPRTSLRLWPVFEKAGEPGIFSVPEPRRKLGIFPSPKTRMVETVRTVTPRLACFTANRLYLKEEERTEFSQVPESI